MAFSQADTKRIPTLIDDEKVFCDALTTREEKFYLSLYNNEKKFYRFLFELNKVKQGNDKNKNQILSNALDTLKKFLIDCTIKYCVRSEANQYLIQFFLEKAQEATSEDELDYYIQVFADRFSSQFIDKEVGFKLFTRALNSYKEARHELQSEVRIALGSTATALVNIAETGTNLLTLGAALPFTAATTQLISNTASVANKAHQASKIDREKKTWGQIVWQAITSPFKSAWSFAKANPIKTAVIVLGSAAVIATCCFFFPVGFVLAGVSVLYAAISTAMSIKDYINKYNQRQKNKAEFDKELDIHLGTREDFRDEVNRELAALRAGMVDIYSSTTVIAKKTGILFVPDKKTDKPAASLPSQTVRDMRQPTPMISLSQTTNNASQPISPVSAPSQTTSEASQSIGLIPSPS